MNNKNIIGLLMVVSLFISCDKKVNKNLENKVIFPNNLALGVYNANTIQSIIEWSGRKVAYGHNGTLNLKSGKMEVFSDGKITGEFKIDMNSIIVTDLEGKSKENLERHLKDSDFFGVNEFPIASVKFIAHQNEIINNVLEMKGELTIKNITHPISFKATIDQVAPILKTKASVVFDRSEYDIRFGSGKFFDNLGDKMILDDINVDVSLIFNK